ncbi:FliH/SctL family protein [Arthrobacter sp. STN4]|uniref:FliH/SctL family protein n=1 Tax=Arthrobacter sp. STN4 TaxID=2923276 RepID=UPI00211A3D56|nr:FliH/SctL family protein [Arthrobacter sp. STN4]MCQ9162503.1 flagellar assembly protein FliH [Arthrobacter sp. STN4]
MPGKAAGGRADSAVPVVYPVLTGAAGPAQHREHVRGFTEGHAAGYTAGLRHAAEETARLRARLTADHAALAEGLRTESASQLAAMRAAAEAFSRAPLPLLADAEQTLLECALALAAAVLGREVADAGAASRAALARALAGPDAAAPANIRMNPQDVAVLQAAYSRASAPGAATPALPGLVADPSLSRGDAVAEFPDGFLDARITTALERARQELLGGGG